MRHSRTLNYLERITLFDPARMIGMDDLAAISVETPMIDSKVHLEKFFIELICMNH